MPPRREPSQVPSRTESPTPDEDETPWFDNVDELQQHGINVQDILKLKVSIPVFHASFCAMISRSYP
ncbi:hypothetical protein E1B28_000840 [Marasmius oreades]|uniref:Uncharacterized protein n=1 Tax=Marasmius oreades TaxID=181124 RepID=A0A9P7V265_9AGAR|nr:uncharacterized protein E1B28_000840 [Marasmius oreades]KAG7098950.1 hypothetical protein E1B28_000840 [Marasmius oreades]